MKRGPLLITICSLIVLVALAAWPVIRIARALDRGQENARAAFHELRRTAVNLLAHPDDSTGQAWRTEVGKAWKKQTGLLAVIIRDERGEILYARPEASPYYTISNNKLGFGGPEGSTLRFNGPLSAGMSMEALYVSLSQESVFYPVRDALVALASLLAVLVAWLLVISNRAQASVEPAVARLAPAPAAQDYQPPTAPASFRQEDPSDEWVPGIPDMLPDESPLYTETPYVPEDEPEVTPEHFDPKPLVVEPSDLPKDILDGPRGLFDEESGLGWEAYLRERLSAELRRSASFEQDLSLLILSMDEVKRGDQEFNLFAATVGAFFSFKDMAFLFGEGGAALILPNMDVDHALRMCEELQKKLALLFRSKQKSGSPLVAMGLSSRAGRLVDANRIISEAMVAASKARDDGGSRIVAFKPDPEKFRAYLAGQ